MAKGSVSLEVDGEDLEDHFGSVLVTGEAVTRALDNGQYGTGQMLETQVFEFSRRPLREVIAELRGRDATLKITRMRKE